MSIRIKISYTEEEEYKEIARLLSPIGVKSWKKQPAKGKYKRAYAERSREQSPSEQREVTGS